MKGHITLEQAKRLWERVSQHKHHKEFSLRSLSVVGGVARYYIVADYHPEYISEKFRKYGGKNVSVRRQDLGGKFIIKVKQIETQSTDNDFDNSKWIQDTGDDYGSLFYYPKPDIDSDLNKITGDG